MPEGSGHPRGSPRVRGTQTDTFSRDGVSTGRIRADAAGSTASFLGRAGGRQHARLLRFELPQPALLVTTEHRKTNAA